VKVTPDGNVKVLDFGLAKAMENTPAAGNLSQSPTMTFAATQAGMILGTAAYMSPEQAKGLNTDQRSDIFSFGAVLFEMVTGRQAFSRRHRLRRARLDSGARAGSGPAAAEAAPENRRAAPALAREESQAALARHRRSCRSRTRRRRSLRRKPGR
jgi:serine/threonine protein kinase